MNLTPPTLQYPCATLNVNERTSVVAGIDAVRVAVPWALNHVNCWLLEETEKALAPFSLIDTGIKNKSTKTLWQSLLGDQAPAELLITHYHPDHSGLAGWFSERGSQLVSHSDEIRVMHKIWASSEASYVAEFTDWYLGHGLAEEHTVPLPHIGHGYRATVAELPPEPNWRTLEAGDEIRIGQRQFSVLTGFGHAPAMLMLYCADDELLIAADQVLPRISPNVSVLPGAPDKNPLGSFMSSLSELRKLPENTLVLPSHGDPFVGLHERVDFLLAHHELRLNQLRKICTKPLQAADVLSTLFQRELDVQQMSFALGEAVAHLRYLAIQGELVEHHDNGKIIFSPS